jgi:hypothetical protein
VLEGGLDGISGRAAKRFARVVLTPWTLATGADRRHSSQPAKPLPERLLDRYLDRLTATAPLDRELTLAFNRVLNLLAAPPSLLAPRVVVRVLRPRRRPRLRAVAGPSAVGAETPETPRTDNVGTSTVPVDSTVPAPVLTSPRFHRDVSR